MLSLLTLNIQAPALSRARDLLAWLDTRDDDLVILTETSAGEGTAHLLEQCRRAGMAVLHTPHPGERGVALLARVPVTARPELLAGVSIPGRAVAATVDIDTPFTVIGVYVPSSDRAPDKVTRKRVFVSTFLDAIARLPEAQRHRLVLGGDYNVIARDHRPAYRGFLPFEYEMLDRLHEYGLADAHEHCCPGVQAHSWIGRTSNGYRFDYVHIGAALVDRLTGCDYLHQPRELKLSDHAAVAVGLDMAPLRRLELDPAGLTGTGTLF
ncbi:endonuclease/exonuclease/phosphatase family protein [Allorhizocola rhizosphaerae]|uniref:endonuclease/exonuclease/phosphatase family protein n=1 Tax=Allorhizocola rhizosphaerae TaxID=1872709 RepID=UPI000E3B7A3C|nr:endonuclease/exonuclease/phosphatase family protein [Allorhizocola rhizosphaerae]